MRTMQENHRVIRYGDTEVEQKRCIGCNKWLALSEFRKKGPGKRSARCRECLKRRERSAESKREYIRPADPFSSLPSEVIIAQIRRERYVKLHGKRVCAADGCTTKLSVYNTGQFCSRCEARRRESLDSLELLEDLEEESLEATSGQALRERRERVGLSLEKLAILSGVGKSTIYDIEAGRRNPTLKTRKKVNRALLKFEMGDEL